MKIYFCGSIRGGRDDVTLYLKIVTKLKSVGTVLTEHVSDTQLTHTGEGASGGGDKFIHDRDVTWLQECDAVVAEVTQPSLGVGYELGRAVVMKKPTLCLFRPSCGRVLSAMIRGADDGETFVVRDYSQDQLDQVLDQFFNSLTRNQSHS